MKKLSDDVIHFLKRQNFTIISTIDADERSHSSCKGIVKIDPAGRIYLLDLYKGRTYGNLIRNSKISLTVVDEHPFKGYCLKGRAKIVKADKLRPQIIEAWEDKITSRTTQRVLRNIRGEKGHPMHPEILLPKPEYLIVMEVEKIVDLIPHKLR